MPTLPEWTNEDLEFEGQIINLKKMACNCDHSQTKKGLYHQNDLRLICNHIFDKILSEEKYMNIFDELTLLLMQSVLMNDEKMLIISRNITGGSTFYIGGNKGSNIYNIYAETNNKWKKYSYSTKNNKWSYDNFPNNPKMILETLKRNEFIFSKYLGVE
jgi:hypothetical protein